MGIFLMIVSAAGLLGIVTEGTALLRERRQRSKPLDEMELGREAIELRSAGWDVRLTQDGSGMFAVHTGRTPRAA